MAFGIDAGMLPHHENWREFPVMVSVRFTPLRSESATTVAELLDLDDVACSHLTAIIALPADPDNKYRAVMTGRAASQRPSK